MDHAFTIPQGNLTLVAYAPTVVGATVTSPRTVGYEGAPLWWGDEREWSRRIAETTNRLLVGRLNSTGSVTLDASSATTTLANALISGDSKIFFTPTTANASAEVGAGTIYVSAVAEGSATITHANNAQTDRTFWYVILG